MKNQENKGLEVKKGVKRVKCVKGLSFPHLGSRITASYPPFEGFSWDVAKETDRRKLERPTLGEIASFIYALHKSHSIPVSHDSFRAASGGPFRNSLSSFTGILYSMEGMFIEDNPKIEGAPTSIFTSGVVMDLSDLEKRLKDGDPNVRYVPYGCKSGYQTPEEFLENPLARVLVGEEGVEKLAEIGRELFASRGKKVLWSIEPKKENRKTIFLDCFTLDDFRKRDKRLNSLNLISLASIGGHILEKYHSWWQKNEFSNKMEEVIECVPYKEIVFIDCKSQIIYDHYANDNKGAWVQYNEDEIASFGLKK